jgi:hypothetical protein
MSRIPGQGDLSDRWQMILNFTIGPMIPIDRLLVVYDHQTSENTTLSSSMKSAHTARPINSIT